MAKSFPGAPDSGGGSFPQGDEPRDSAPTQPDGLLLFRRYRVLRQLGRGGMGVVMLAQDTALNVPVALKMVPDALHHEADAIAGLRKEVLRGMALSHDGVVRTITFERDESGAAIVMEYVDGFTLAELRAQQPGGCFDPEQILPWLEVLCEVLDYAHQQKHFVHRDLKPRNVMLTRDGRLKVADFGIAAVITDSMSQHSKEGCVSGTLSYMSPQQAEGKRPHPLDDIHALGATIYELLTGKPPFFRGNEAALFGQLLHVVPPSMAERRDDLGVEGKQPIPPSWEEAIAACLAKDPAARPASAGEVLRRLKAPAAQPPIHHPPQVSGIPPEPQKRRIRTAAPVGWLAVVPTVGMVIAAGLYLGIGTNGQKTVTQEPSTPEPSVPATPAPTPPPPLSTPALSTPAFSPRVFSPENERKRTEFLNRKSIR